MAKSAHSAALPVRLWNINLQHYRLGEDASHRLYRLLLFSLSNCSSIPHIHVYVSYASYSNMQYTLYTYRTHPHALLLVDVPSGMKFLPIYSFDDYPARVPREMRGLVLPCLFSVTNCPLSSSFFNLSMTMQHSNRWTINIPSLYRVPGIIKNNKRCYPVGKVSTYRTRRSIGRV